MEVAPVDKTREHPRAVGANGGAQSDDLARELDHVQAAGLVGQFQPDPAEAAALVPLDSDRDGRLVTGGPALAGARPPTKLWSSSTTPPSRSRSGRTMARRNLCSHTHAVSYEPNPNASFRPCAETPFFCEVTNQTAANQVDNGVCDR